MVLILLYILCSESLYSSKVVLWDKVCINIEECVDLNQIPVLCSNSFFYSCIIMEVFPM